MSERSERTIAAPRRLVVGISGSSAPHYGIALLSALRDLSDVETHLVVSSGAHRTIELETDLKVVDVEALADVVHEPGDLAASISSGSFLTMGMVVVPCSMRHAGGDRPRAAATTCSRAPPTSR